MIANRLLGGWATHLLQISTVVVLQIVMVPVYLKYWSHEMFAAWLIIVSLSSIVPLADLGLQGAALKLFQRARVSLDPDGRTGAVFTRLMSTYLLVAAFVIIATTSALLAMEIGFSSVPEIFRVPNFSLAAGIVIAASALQLPTGATSMLYRCNDQAAMLPLAQSIASLTAATVQFLVISAGGSLLSVAFIQAAALVGFSGHLLFIDQRRRFPNLSWSIQVLGVRRTFGELRSAAPFGVASGVDLLLSYGPIILLGGLAFESSVVLAWSLSRTLVSVIRQIAIQIMLPLIAEVGREFYLKRDERVMQLILFGLITVSVLTSVMSAGVLAFGSNIFELWTKNNTLWDASLVGWLVAASIVAAPLAVGYLLAFYLGDKTVLFRSKLWQLLLVTFICGPMMASFGIYGLAVTLLLGELLPLFLFIWPKVIAPRLLKPNRQAFVVGATTIVSFLLSFAVAELVSVTGHSAQGFAIQISIWAIISLGASIAYLRHFVWRAPSNK